MPISSARHDARSAPLPPFAFFVRIYVGIVLQNVAEGRRKYATPGLKSTPAASRLVGEHFYFSLLDLDQVSLNMFAAAAAAQVLKLCEESGRKWLLAWFDFSP